MQFNPKHEIWYEKYRPQNINDLILPEPVKTKLKEFIEKPFHLLLVSKTPGTGKTSTASALVKEGNFESLFINASLDNGIDTLRSRVIQFASTESVNGKDKIVICDEIENYSQNAGLALRGLIEEFSGNCKFIATCNYISKVLPAIVNRFCVFDYDKIYEDAKTMIPLIYERLKFILNNENVDYVSEDIIKAIKGTYPSFREAIGILQKSTISGKFEITEVGSDYGEIWEAIKTKNYENIVKAVYKCSNPDGFYTWAYEKLNADTARKPTDYVSLAKYQYQGAFARDTSLNLIACCVELASH